MLAIDTNLVVRYLTNDHPKQSPRARALIDDNAIWIGATVLLESAWVLASAYGYAAAEVAASLRGLAGLPSVTVQDPIVVARALDWTEQGMDLADALRLAAASDCEAFVSFDAKLAKTAARLGLSEVRQP